MQKLVTVYLDTSGFERKRSGIIFSTSEFHGRVDEYLADYLEDGWKIIDLSTMPAVGTGAWVVVALEKPDATPDS